MVKDLNNVFKLISEFSFFQAALYLDKFLTELENLNNPNLEQREKVIFKQLSKGDFYTFKRLLKEGRVFQQNLKNIYEIIGQ